MRIATIALLLGLFFMTNFCAFAADEAPDFTLKDLKGKNVKLSEVLKNGPVLLSFWSTWCKNCPEEMKHFQRFFNTYQEQGLTVLAISIDTSKTLAKVKPWIKGRRFDYPVLLDTKGNVKRLYHVKAVPHSFVISKEGKIVYSHIGYRTGEEKPYEDAIKKLLSAKTEEK